LIENAQMHFELFNCVFTQKYVTRKLIYGSYSKVTLSLIFVFISYISWWSRDQSVLISVNIITMLIFFTHMKAFSNLASHQLFFFYFSHVDWVKHFSKSPFLSSIRSLNWFEQNCRKFVLQLQMHAWLFVCLFAPCLSFCSWEAKVAGLKSFHNRKF